MKKWIVAILALVVCLPYGVATAQSLKDPSVRRELLDRMKQDSKLRADAEKKGTADSAALDKSEADNSALLEKVVADYGWPTASIVGPSASAAAFYLAENASLDLQKRCLALLEQAVAAGKESPDRLAYLTDVVRLREGKRQVYGTQLRLVDGKYQPAPIEDESNVDARRSEIGLGPLADHVERAQRSRRS